MNNDDMPAMLGALLDIARMIGEIGRDIWEACYWVASRIVDLIFTDRAK